jgi:predicted amidohydrolase YtcJ
LPKIKHSKGININFNGKLQAIPDFPSTFLKRHHDLSINHRWYKRKKVVLHVQICNVMTKKIKIFFIILILIPGCKTNKKMEFADLIITGGNIVTMDNQNTKATAIAVKDGRIFQIGDADDLESLIGEKTKVIKLNGEMVMPGFIEGHGHFMSMGQNLQNLDLMKIKNFGELLDSVKNRLQSMPENAWLYGRGWHQEKWDKLPDASYKGFPVHDALSAISPDNPVILSHASGHAILVNQQAMELAGITDETPDPEGGVILRNSDGKAVGIFEENAESLIWNAVEQTQKAGTPEDEVEEQKQIVQLAVENCWKNGITTFQDAGADFETIRFFKQLAEHNELGIRLYVMINEPVAVLKDSLAAFKPINDDYLKVNALKTWFDGALGTRSALLSAPYEDDPGNFGQNTLSPDDLYEIGKLALENNMQLCTHAIGDSANHIVLNIYEKLFNGKDGKAFRWRIEHAQHINPEDQLRFAGLGVIASMQSIHCSSDAPYVLKRIGAERAAENAYPWRSLINFGTMMMEGTDVPVEDIDPLANVYAAVTRKMKNGEPFFAEQAKTMQEELKQYTYNNAYGAFWENETGTLEKGKWADIVILSKDLENIPVDEIKDVKVLYTIVGGEVKYRDKDME